MWNLILKQLVHDFMENVNLMRKKRCLGPVSFSTAVKFLCARKFDINRAVALYEQHEDTRDREGLTSFDPSVDPLKSELHTAKFTILVSFVCISAIEIMWSGSEIFELAANERQNWRCYRRIHSPYSLASGFFASDDVAGNLLNLFIRYQMSNLTILHYCNLAVQGIVYQLDAALESVDTQKAGLVFIYDMSDSKYSNFDYDLSKKILMLLKVSLIPDFCYVRRTDYWLTVSVVLQRKILHLLIFFLSSL